MKISKYNCTHLSVSSKEEGWTQSDSRNLFCPTQNCLSIGQKKNLKKLLPYFVLSDKQNRIKTGESENVYPRTDNDIEFWSVDKTQHI